MVTIVSLLEGGFRILRERAGALLIWTGVQLVATIAGSFAMAWALGSSMDAAASGLSQNTVQMTYVLQTCLVALGGMVFTTVLYAAAQRVVIYPMEGGPGWLKLGMDEVRLFLLACMYIIGFSVVFVVGGFSLAMLLGGAGPEIAQIVLILLALILGAWLGTRLSLTFPLTLKRRAFAVSDGWALTKGHGWTLFAAYFIIFLMLTICGVLIMLVTQPDYFSAILQYGFGSPQADLESVRQYHQLLLGEIDGPMVIAWVLTSIQGAVGYALMGGAAATAVQQLTADEEGLAETFS